MNGYPRKRIASVPHTCKKCGKKIARGEENFTIAIRGHPTSRYYTVYLCVDCALKHIDSIFKSAQQLQRMYK